MKATRLFFLLLVLSLLFSCGEEKPDLAALAAELSAPGVFGVGVKSLTFIDKSRPTAPNNTYPGAPDRTLETEIWYPTLDSTGAVERRDASLAAEGGPFPLVIFCHGFMAFNRQSVSITKILATHGYVVAAPNFPLSNTFAPGGPTADLHNQPQDISFLIDTLLDLSAKSGEWLAGAIDPDAIGVTGHSLGGGTTIMTVFGPLADPRIRAAVPLAPFACLYGDNFYAAGGVPTLLIGGERDIFTRFESNLERPYNLMPVPKYLAEIAGGTHIGFADFDFAESSELTQVMFGLNPSADMIEGFLELIEITDGNFAYCTDLFSPADALEAIPPLKADRQREITRILLNGFFDLYLKGGDKYRPLFRAEVSSLIPELTLNWQEE